MRIGTLKIGQRLTLGFGLAMVAMAAVIVFGAVQLVAIERGIDVIANERYPQTALADSIKSDSYEVVQGMRDILLLSDAQEIKDRITDMDQAAGFADQSLAELYHRPAVSAQENELRKNVSQARDDFKVELDSFKQLVLTGQRDMARDVLYTRAETARLAVFQSLNNVIAFHADATASSSHVALARASQAVLVMLALGGAACVLALAIGVLVRRSIVRPLQQAVALAGCVAEGDLAAAASIQTDSASRDETGVLVQSLKVMNAGLAEIAGGVRRGTDAIATASAEIAHGSMDLAARTERQAASVERVVASMDDLTRTVQQNADHARQAAQLAAEASDVALKGGAVVEQVVDNMRSIHTSARKIEDITSVIDGIAFQTNILALNAAVEAARAGEQGRGFAVVAAEVRNLAQRSAGAAKEIKQLIVDSVQRINAGNTLAGQAGETMTDVVASVRQVAGIIVEISHASGAQSEGIGQLGNALAQIDAATSQNAALVEEAAAAAERMREEALALADAVGFFKLAPVAEAGPDVVQPAPASPAPALIALPA